ncbi:MAG TPA: leucine--tRNA ligase, partial [Chitinophagales bacterium]|nr:leucine--tRNA ligase [Chitinophagales bacterium]
MDLTIGLISEIEKKWQSEWRKSDLYKVTEDPSRPKYYVLDMFPYPSGSGLHVGHPLGYVASDIISRYKRLKGFNVLHPMGFDAFGLPAEQYAIETGQHPAVTTEKNIAYFREQLDRMGFCYDWNRGVKTSDPSYYKWTQWIFMQLFKHWYDPFLNKAQPIADLEQMLEKEGSARLIEKDICDTLITADQWKSMSGDEKQKFLMNFRLAFLDHAAIWWCEALGTVLANDEVKDGVSERGGHPVEKIRMRQWFLRITAYAERLLSGLETVDFSDSMKEMQRNWIGKSEGALVDFKVEGSENQIRIFTTRPDTIFGATFMVLAPEHELVQQITSIDQQDAVSQYINYVKSRSERDRMSEVKKVTGQFTGAYAIHPFTGNKIPIYIAEYVLAGYGTGAIMAVPSNDDRDAAFAEKFNLPIIPVVDQSNFPGAAREDKVGVMINSDMLNGLPVTEAISTMINAIATKGIGRRKINFRLRDAGFSRQRYWGEPFPVYYINDIPYLLDESELPVILPQVESYKPAGAAQSPLSGVTDWVNLPNGARRETDTMPGYAGSSWYYFRYMDVHNDKAFASKEALDYWQDIDLYIGGTEHAVGHLLYSRMWCKFLFDIGLVPKEEPYKRLVNQGMIQGWSKIVYRIVGTNTFVSKQLKDQHETTELRVDIKMVAGDILDTEAFKKWRTDFANAEFILEDGKYYCGTELEKMSKSKHNVVNPDDVINQYGADCFRLYEMFLGPLDQGKPWDTKGITGVQGFLRKLWRLCVDEQGNMRVTNDEPSNEEFTILHRTIKKVTDDIERMSMNTVVSTFMICVNDLSAGKCYKRAIIEPLLVMTAPFAPFLSEELYNKLGNDVSVHKASWPEVDERYLVRSSIPYAVQVNGKLRATV